MTDLPVFEPELDAITPMVERFSREKDRYLMLFTKSNNVDFLKAIDHRGHTIISWSITCDTASRSVDKRTASMRERIEAMAKMQEAGYIVRARLSPVVPIKNWKREYTELFEMLFSKAKPDLVTLEHLGWMDFDDLLEIFDRQMLDPDATRDAEQGREKLAKVFWGPFTQRTHEDVYGFCIDTVKRLSPGTPVSVCHGSPATWEVLGPAMQMTPESFICNCGPDSTPGGTLYDQWVRKCANA